MRSAMSDLCCCVTTHLRNKGWEQGLWGDRAWPPPSWLTGSLPQVTFSKKSPGSLLPQHFILLWSRTEIKIPLDSKKKKKKKQACVCIHTTKTTRTDNSVYSQISKSILKAFTEDHNLTFDILKVCPRKTKWCLVTTGNYLGHNGQPWITSTKSIFLFMTEKVQLCSRHTHQRQLKIQCSLHWFICKN